MIVAFDIYLFFQEYQYESNNLFQYPLQLRMYWYLFIFYSIENIGIRSWMVLFIQFIILSKQSKHPPPQNKAKPSK